MTAHTLSKEKIITAAKELINDQENLTFTKLSRKLGIRSQGIYNYYSDIMAVKIGVAVSFYDELTVRLKADLLGLTGKQAIKAFANIIVHYALDNFLITQQIISIPAGKLNDSELNNSLINIRTILRLFLDPLVENKEDMIVVSRMLRNLVVGEILHVGNGRFEDKTISAPDSFNQMLDITLAKY